MEGGILVVTDNLNYTSQDAYRFKVQRIILRSDLLFPEHIFCLHQEAARNLRTLREVEPLLSGGCDILAVAATAARLHLHEGAYEAAEVEGIIGLSLDALYADNQHSQRYETRSLNAVPWT